jgi:hypothetical protein
MTHKSSTTLTTPLRTFAAISAALLSTMLFVACSSGPQAALPFAPSALPSSMLPLEAADGIDAWGTLGKGNDKDRDKGDKGKGKDDDTENEDGERNPHDGTRPFHGTVSNFRGVCEAVTFNLKGLTIVADAATIYLGGGGTCATLRPNVKVVVTGTPGAERRTFKAAAITITRTH